MSTFKIILMCVFGAGALIGMVVFASYRGNNSAATGPVLMWGFIPKSSFDAYAKDMGFDQSKQFSLTYVEKNPKTFEDEYEKALADGKAPDLLMIRDDLLATEKNRLFVIPYTSYAERDYKNNFVQSTEIFLGNTGVYAVPLYIDPLVMYWNRTLFTNASIPVPPQYWDQFLTLPSQLTKKNVSGTINQSLAALGEWTNITNAKEILSNLLLQGGISIVDQPRTGPGVSTILYTANGDSVAGSVVNFYTQFANPVTAQYSWNRSLPNSTTYFLLGNLATYFGFASELPVLRSKNPNLDFDVALMPQPRATTAKKVFGHIYGLAISKQAKNVSGAFIIISQMTTEAGAKTLETYTNLPTPRRAVLSTKQSDPYKAVFYQSAIQSATWVDPDRKGSSAIFQTMIESITSGRSRVSDAVQKANNDFEPLFSQ